MFTTTFLLVLIIALLVVVMLALFGVFFSLSKILPLRRFLKEGGLDRHDWPYRFYGPLFEIIEKAERETGVKLTWAAREMLIIPIIEQLQEGPPVSTLEIQSSILSILVAIREEQTGRLRSRSGAWSAVAIIKGFFKRYCSIPPFCTPGEEPRSEGRR